MKFIFFLEISSNWFKITKKNKYNKFKKILGGLYIQYFSNGDRYEGEWKLGKLEHGEWKCGQMEGKGTYYLVKGERYEGEWKDGKMDGKGTYFWTSGEKYEGEWKDNKKNGTGIYYYNDGTIMYEGN